MNEHPGNGDGVSDGPRKTTARFNWLRRMLYGIAIFLVLVIGLLFLAGTGPVLRLALPTVQQAVSAAIGGRLSVEGLRGSLWTGLDIDSLSLAMPATGLAVEGRRLALQWSPLALFQGTVQLDRLAAEELSVTLPHSPGPDTPPEEQAEMPTLPLAIRLGQLDLPRIDITEPTSGRRFSYGLTASGLAERRAAELALALTPREDDQDLLTVDLAFHADRRELRAEIDGRFHRTGLVMTLAGLSPEEATDITIMLKGEGPAEGWRGRLQLTAADLAELAGDLGLQLDRRELGFSFSGAAGPVGRLAAELPRQLQGSADIDLAGRYGMEAETLTFSRLKLTKPELLILSATADLDLAANQLTARLNAQVDGAASALLGDQVQWQGLDLQGEAKGNLEMPDLRLTVEGRGVATPVFSTRDLSLTVLSAARGDRLAVEAKGTALGNDWTEAELTAILGERLEVALEADVAGDFRDIIVQNLKATAGGVRLTGRAGMNDEGAVTAAAVTADVADLAIFSTLAGMELGGAGRLTIKDGAWSSAGGGRAEIEVAAQGLGMGQSDLDRLVGTQPSLAGRIELSPRRDLRITLDRVDLAMTDGSLSFAFSDDFSRMSVGGKLAVLPGALPPASGVDMGQPAQLAVQLEGPPQAPAGEIRLAVPKLEAGGELFDNLALTSTMQWADETVLSLANRLDFNLRKKPYTLQADVALPPDRLKLDHLSLKGDGLELAGQLELPDYGPLLRGTVRVTQLDASLLQDLQAPVAAGEVTGKVDFLPEKEQQRINFDFTAQGVRLAGGDHDGLDRITLRGHLADAFGEPVVELRSTAAKIAYGETLLDNLQATLRGPPAKLQTTVETAGRLQAREALPVNLSASAQIGLTEEIWLEIPRLTAAIGTQKITLRKPLTLKRTANGTIDGTAALAIGPKGRLDGTYTFVPAKKLSATAELAGIALGPWDEMFAHQGLTGTLAASASLNEQAGEPAEARLSASVRDIRLADPAGTATTSKTLKTPQLPPLAMQLDASLAKGRLEGTLSAGEPDLQVLTAQANLPLDVSLLDSRYDVNPRAPLDVRVSGDAQIAQFWPYVPLTDHSLAGQLKLNANLSGSLTEPSLDGTVQLADGRYEHLQFGTLLQNLRIDGSLDSGGVHLKDIAADDGGRGTVAGNAKIEIGGSPPVAYRATVVMRDMAVTRMDELQLFGDIDLNLTGDDRSAAIKGEVKVTRGEVDLAVALPPSVPTLEVDNLREAGGDSARDEQQEKEQEKGEEFAAQLQLSVDIPGQLFVRGKGLDSEWGGHLDIEGPAGNPRIVGNLQARRGQLEVIGTTFAIRDSQVTFLGGQPPDPQLNIVGIHKTGDIEVKANLTGTASKTQLALSSEPQLPQDEILSRILFGKSQGKLSAYEAVQLAGVAADLTGTASGFDIMGSLRKFLHVDVLRVEGGEGGPEVEVGKYLTEGVYVGTKRGTTSDSTGVEVEIELTPHIKATSESNEIDNKAGLQFKWDY